MHRILLIDDDEDLAPPLATYLSRFDLHARPRHAAQRRAWSGCARRRTTP